MASVWYSFLRAWGSEGSAEGQFNSPQGIAIDSQGDVYVTDYQNYRVQKFDSNGEFITEWGSRGFGEAEFDRPLDIAIGLQGYAYVIDLSNRVQVWAPAAATWSIQWATSRYFQRRPTHTSKHVASYNFMQ